MAKKRNAVLKHDEIKEVVTDAIDELLQTELAKLEGVKEPAKQAMTKNLNQYYKAQRKMHDERVKI